MEGGVLKGQLAEQAVVAQHLAMVGGENDQRPIDLSRPVQMRQHPAQLVVDLGHQPGILAADPHHRHIVDAGCRPGSGGSAMPLAIRWAK